MINSLKILLKTYNEEQKLFKTENFKSLFFNYLRQNHFYLKHVTLLVTNLYCDRYIIKYV